MDYHCFAALLLMKQRVLWIRATNSPRGGRRPGKVSTLVAGKKAAPCERSLCSKPPGLLASSCGRTREEPLFWVTACSNFFVCRSLHVKSWLQCANRGKRAPAHKIWSKITFDAGEWWGPPANSRLSSGALMDQDFLRIHFYFFTRVKYKILDR